MRCAFLLSFSLVVAAACSGEEPPSCQQAVTHYYSAGCAYFDLATGDPIPAGEMVARCRNDLAQAPASCSDEFDDWLFCTDGVPSNATSNADCDCSQEQEALLTCG